MATLVHSPSFIGHDKVIANRVLISPSVTVGGRCRIGALSFLGIGATVIDSIRVGDECLIGAGALVVKDTLPRGCYIGQPARRVKDFDESGVVISG